MLLPTIITMALLVVHLNRAAFWVQEGIKGFWLDTRIMAQASKVMLIASLLASLFAQIVVSREVALAVVSVLFIAHLGFMLGVSMKR
jgi:hypothetical protein